ncbi:MAG: uridine diphosphate-N-acetylglucosamine-binding protein YvcK [Trueperaceae bacterium]|nr:uridine diphosphate-N-acetylglucosamine-binding protein YvcK [Trueperaceae bacterium]
MLRKRLLRQAGIMRLWLIPGMRVKRYVSVAVIGTLLLVVGVILGVLWILQERRDVISTPLEEVLVSQGWHLWGGWISAFSVLIGLSLSISAVARLNRSLLSNWFPRPKEAAYVLSQRLSLAKGPKIVALGGGTGLSNLLRGLRNHSSNLTAVVTVSDDGGSSGRLRTAFNMPAPGDISDCLAALSDNESELSRLLEYRFLRGNELKGHTFGNLFITTLTEVEGDFGKAIRTLNALLNLTGAVYPATPEVVSLHAEKQSGEQVIGESNMRLVAGAVKKVSIEPSHPPPTPEVLNAIIEADAIILGPGSLFTSTLPPLLVPAIRRALQGTHAQIIYVCNIMTEAGETDGFSALDHVQAIYNHLGRYPDKVIVNGTPIDEARLMRYREENAEIVSFDSAAFEQLGIELLPLPILGSGPHAQHDSLALANWISTYAKRGPVSSLRKELVSA